MPTKLYSANITLGDEPKVIVLRNEVVKKLPLNILMSNAHFIAWINTKISITERKRLINKKTGLLTVNVEYLKQIGITNNEPIID